MDILRGVRKRRRKEPARKPRKFRLYAPDYKLRVIKLHLEEGVPVPVIQKETGVNRTTI